MIILDMPAADDKIIRDMPSDMPGHTPDGLADYRGPEREQLLRAHLVGACCISCLASTRGKAGRDARRQARKIQRRGCEVHEFAAGDIVYKLSFTDEKGKHQVMALPLEDKLPEEWHL